MSGIMLTNNVWIGALCQKGTDSSLCLVVTGSMDSDPDICVLPYVQNIQENIILVFDAIGK